MLRDVGADHTNKRKVATVAGAAGQPCETFQELLTGDWISGRLEQASLAVMWSQDLKDD